MGFDPAHQHVITVVEEMVCGHGRRDAIAARLHKLHRIARCDVLEYDSECWKRFG